MRFSSDPAQIIIDQSHFRVLEDQKEILVIPVEVADGDDLLNPRPFVRGLGRRAEGGKGEKEKAGGYEEISFLRHVLRFFMIPESRMFFTPEIRRLIQENGQETDSPRK
jgi:hypothetical protein